MITPVDLTNLRSMTDGDAEMEKALFAEFYDSFEAGIVTLESSTAQETAEDWRKAAHALKGIALNLGAEQLGNSCKLAQEAAPAPANDKQQLLSQITLEYTQVKKFLEKLV